MELPSLARASTSIGLSLAIALYGLRRKSLSRSGALSAIVVGTVLTAASACFCMSLLAFFLTSSRLTKWKSAEKKKLEHDHKEGERSLGVFPALTFDLSLGGQRNWVQVLSNGGVATVAALCYIATSGCGEQPLSPTSLSSPSFRAAIACLSSLACCCGDTWASEVGAVLGGTPYLVTTWRRVPKGTNGGVSLVGTLCSGTGGLVVGVAYFLGLALFIGFESPYDALQQAWVLPLGALAGLWGSLVDSLLGATLQYSGFSKELGCVVHGPTRGSDVKHISGWDVLDNHAVNFLSSAITALTITISLA